MKIWMLQVSMQIESTISRFWFESLLENNTLEKILINKLKSLGWFETHSAQT